MVPSRPRGKPPSVKPDDIVTVIKRHKKDILENDSSVSTENNSVWQIVSDEFKGKLKPSTLYSYVVNNRYGLKSILLGDETTEKQNSNNSVMDTTGETTLLSDASLGSNIETCVISMPKQKFQKLVTESIYSRKLKNGKKKVRYQTTLKQKEWSSKIAAKLVESNLTHAFHFKNHYLSRNASEGIINGYCRCGSIIKCTINNSHSEITNIYCSITTGNSSYKCGKRQCRGKEREKKARELCTMSTEAYRAEEARKRIKQHGDCEPPNMYSAAVLRQAKHDFVRAQYLDKDPIKALQKMKRGSIGHHVIRSIGYDPFFVHFASKHQIRLWNKYSDHIPLLIDATSGVATKLEHFNGEKSHSIFLYIAVVNTPVGQFSVAQMLSERQDTVAISNWLRDLMRIGANFPKQVICDASRALLSACVWSFTGHKTIEHYCNAFLDHHVPEVLISIDVAHYLKIWADFLRDCNTPIKTFYLACMGRLIQCRNINESRELTKALLIVSLSKKDGRLNGREDLTVCEQHRRKLESLITGHLGAELLCDESNEDLQDAGLFSKKETVPDVSEDSSDSDNELISKNEESSESILWENWGKNLKAEVDDIINLKEPGEHINAHHHIKFAAKLLKEVKHIPMWSNIYKNNYFDKDENSRSSSSSVESEFNILKNHVLGPNRKHLRVDSLTEKLIKYYDGKLKLLHAKTSSNDNDTENEYNVQADGSITDKTEDNNNCDMENSVESEESMTKKENIPIECDFIHSKLNRDDTQRIEDELSFDDSKLVEMDVSETGENNLSVECDREYSEISKENVVWKSEVNKVLAIEENAYGKENIFNEYDYLENTIDIKISKANDRSPLTEKILCESNLSCISCQINNNKITQDCVTCHQKVHYSNKCSIKLNDEGYNQIRRICKKCNNLSRKDEKITLNAFENHKGLAEKDLNKMRNRKSKYLGESTAKIKDIISATNFNTKALPILKNGHCESLHRFIKINGCEISLKNTCAFDTLFQLFLCGVYDHREFNNYLNNIRREHQFFDLVLKTQENNVTAATYKIRAGILLNILNQAPEQNAIKEVNCAITIEHFAVAIFKSSPSFVKTDVCKCGYVQKYPWPTSSISIDALREGGHTNIIDQYVWIRKNRPCTECNMRAEVEIQTGTIIGFEVYAITEPLDTNSKAMNPYIQIGEIPRKIADISDTEYHLVGVAEYVGAERSQKRNDLGHFKAICYRGTSWLEYNDLDVKARNINPRKKIKPRLLIYVKK